MVEIMPFMGELNTYKISNGLFEAKNEKQKLESLLYRLEGVFKETINLKSFVSQLADLYVFSSP
jgi:hypothetical protein